MIFGSFWEESDHFGSVHQKETALLALNGSFYLTFTVSITKKNSKLTHEVNKVVQTYQCERVMVRVRVRAESDCVLGQWFPTVLVSRDVPLGPL